MLVAWPTRFVAQPLEKDMSSTQVGIAKNLVEGDMNYSLRNKDVGMAQNSSSAFLSKSEAVSYVLTAIDSASPSTDNIVAIQRKSGRLWASMQ